MIHSKQKGQRYRRRQADDKDQHNEKEKAILRQGDNCDDQNRTCVVGPFNALFLGRKTHRAYQWSCNEALFSNNNYQYYGLLSRWATTIHKPRPWHKTEIQYAWFWDRTAIICNLQNFSELNNDWVSQKLLSKVPLKSRNLRALYTAIWFTLILKKVPSRAHESYATILFLIFLFSPDMDYAFCPTKTMKLWHQERKGIQKSIEEKTLPESCARNNSIHKT